MFTRHTNNPLIAPQDVKPSRPDFEIIGTFNAGVTRFNNETILLLRVAERPINDDSNSILSPQMSDTGNIIVQRIKRDDARYDTDDSRQIWDLQTGQMLLTSMSHIRLARSKDGVHFTIEEIPWLSAQSVYESYGIEDARITQIEDTYYVNYSAVSSYGISTALVSTKDFVDVQRHGIILAPANRDVAIFPQHINGQYFCYHRPMPGMFGGMHIWIASSPDLLHWGNHQIVLESTSNDTWQGGRIGGGAPPLWTEQGWLSIYHAADTENCYSLGAFLTAHNEPQKIIARTPKPILSPIAKYEVEGFFDNVVFTCGALIQDEQLRVYYGAADEVIALVEAPLKDMLNLLEWES